MVQVIITQSGKWKAPPGIATITSVKCWGEGGSGATAPASGISAGGGGGGAYPMFGIAVAVAWKNPGARID